VSFRFRSSQTRVPHNDTNFGIGTLAAQDSFEQTPTVISVSKWMSEIVQINLKLTCYSSNGESRTLPRRNATDRQRPTTRSGP